MIIGGWGRGGVDHGPSCIQVGGRLWIAVASVFAVPLLWEVATPLDISVSASEGLIVEAWVRHGPVEVLPGQGLPAELVVIGCPRPANVIALCPDNGHLVCP